MVPRSPNSVSQLFSQTTRLLDLALQSTGHIDLQIDSALSTIAPACPLEVTLQGHIYYPFWFAPEHLRSWKAHRQSALTNSARTDVLQLFVYLDHCLMETWDAILDSQRAVRQGRLMISSQRFTKGRFRVVIHAAPERQFLFGLKDWQMRKPVWQSD